MFAQRLTRNFLLSDFSCHDGTPVPEELLANVNALAFQLQIIRDHVQEPLYILSGYRTLAHNTAIGGAPRSQHLLAKAADLHCANKTPLELHAIILDLIKGDFIKQGGVGIYDTFVHYDIRGFHARWDLRKGHH